jgi:DNA-binding beta-propeller fold protein YncE
MPGGHRPYNIWMDPNGKVAYLTFSWTLGSSFSDSILPINTATNKPGKPIRVASGNREADSIVFSPDGKIAYVAAGNPDTSPGTLNPAAVIPVKTATGTPGKPIRLSHGESDIAITPDGRTVYATSGGANRPGYVTAINTATGTPGQPIRISNGAYTMAITPDGKTLYVAGSKAITPISTTTGTPGQPIRVSDGGTMAITPDGKTLYIGRDGLTGGTIVPISTATGTVGKPIHIASSDIAITADGKTLYAAARQGVVPISTATNTPGKPIRPTGYRGVASLWITP